MKECELMNCKCEASFKTRLADWVLLCEAHAELMAKYVGWGRIILAEQDAPPINQVSIKNRPAQRKEKT